MTSDDAFERAARAERDARDHRRRRGMQKSFQIHAVVFAAVQALLFVTWLVTTPGGFPWFVFPFFGWGIGLAAHGYTAYSRD